MVVLVIGVGRRGGCFLVFFYLKEIKEISIKMNINGFFWKERKYV